MISGDLVRFAFWSDLVDINDWSTTPKENVGLLVEYDSLMQQAMILYDGEIQSHRAQLVEKAGKKDILRYKEKNQ